MCLKDCSNNILVLLDLFQFRKCILKIDLALTLYQVL